MHIELQKDAIKGFQVRVVDADGRTVRKFTYPTIESARRAARAWTVAYGNCPVHDTSGTLPRSFCIVSISLMANSAP
jgi:hypothetical protein